MPPTHGSERFRGWSLLGLSTLAISFTLPGQTIGVSSFAEHFTNDLNLSATTLSTAYLIGTIVGSLTMPAFGRWIDRAGVRKTMIAIATAFSFAVAYMGTVHHLWTLVFGFVGIRMLGQGALSLVSQTSIALWFDQKRGLAFAISMTVSAGLMSLGPLALTSLIAGFGWRWAWCIAGGCIFVAVVPTAWRWMEDRPESLGQLPDGLPSALVGSAKKVDHYTVKEAVVTRAFWIMTAVTVVSSALLTGVTFHHFALMKAAGLTTPEAAAVFIAQMVGTVVAGFVWAGLSDRISPMVLLISSQASLVCAHLAYAEAGPGIGAAVYALLLGVNGGSIRALASTLYPKWFGTRHIGAIRGVATAFGVGASAIGPLIVAGGFQITGNYVHLNYALAIIPAAAMLAALFLRPPQKVRSKTSPPETNVG
ncbi:MAG: MFS transporter [Acidimicrobiales bacterium]|nr:MFS transporter [Acidimicrobiales bacterium]